MSKDKKRRPRKELEGKLDRTIPITLEDLGGENDPCFGKLHDPRTKECSRCGDCELCAIAMGQINNLTRVKIEKKSHFKDMEEKEIKPSMTKKEVRKLMKVRVIEMAKQGDEGTKLEVIVEDLYASFNKDGFRKKSITRFINRLVERSSKLKLNKNRVTWKSLMKKPQ